MNRVLIHRGTVVTLGERNRVLPDHDVLVDGERIMRIAPAGTIDEVGARLIDGRGKLVMPGFINAHMHFYSTLVCGLGKARPAKDFAEVLEHLWWRLDRSLRLDDVRVSTLVALIAAVRHGTTTLVDHHVSPGAVRGSLAAIAEAVTTVGLRASLCYEVSDRDGEEVANDGLLENADTIRRYGTVGDDRLRTLFGLHASFTLSDRTLERAVEIAHQHRAGFHVHVAEAASDQDRCMAEHGCRVVERFHRLGVLGPTTIAAHCVHVDEREIDLLAASDTAVAHCPQSNMNNAVGMADTLSMLGRGVLVGLGTDAMTTNMLEELRAALWVRHLATGNPSAGFPETTSLLLEGNRRIGDRYWPGLGLGELREGGAADLVLVDYDPPTPFDEGSFLGHLLFGISQARVNTTICGGRVLMEDTRLCLEVDEAEVAAEARARAAELWEQF